MLVIQLQKTHSKIITTSALQLAFWSNDLRYKSPACPQQLKNKEKLFVKQIDTLRPFAVV